MPSATRRLEIVIQRRTLPLTQPWALSCPANWERWEVWGAGTRTVHDDLPWGCCSSL